MRSSVIGLALVFAASPARAQLTQDPLPAPPELAKALDLEAGTVQDLVLPATAGSFRVSVVLGETRWTLRLQPHDLRSPNFKLLVDDGVEVRQVPTPPSVTYRGVVEGREDSIVAASLVDGQLSAFIRLDGKIWGIQPATQGIPGLPRAAHVVYAAVDSVKTTDVCGLDDLHVRPLHALQPGVPAMEGVPTVREAEIGLDCDFQFYQKNGSSVTNSQNDATNVINGVTTIYKRDVSVQFRITTIIVRTSQVYTTNGGSLLSSFRNRWNGQHSGVQRDVAHLFTGKSTPGFIGIASLAVICNRSSAYGVSWSKYTSNLTRRIGLTAHELGHNFSAGHCNGIGPCWIMCSGLGGCSGSVTKFAPVSITKISNYAANKNCLDVIALSAPTLSSISPDQLQSYNFFPPIVTLTGTDLDSITTLSVGNTQIANFTASQTQITFGMPNGLEIASNPVTATNNVGSSNSLTLTIAGVHPSTLVAPTIHVSGVPFSYTVWTDRDWAALYFISGSNQPSAIPNVVSFGIGNNFADLTLIVPIAADVGGQALFNFTPPAGITGTIYWQVLTVDVNNPTTPFEVSNSKGVTYL